MASPFVPVTFILDLFTDESLQQEVEMSKCTFFSLSYINFRVRFILPAVPFMVTDERLRPR